MRRLALLPLAITLLLFPPLASALGLGEIEMQSALNQRLDAEIPLRGVPEEGADRIIVSLASEEAFRNVGLQRTFSLTRLRFEVKQRDTGGYFVQVTSRDPIVEPFLSFLIEIDWPGGNLLREYTVLLDPPVFVSEEAEAEAEPAEGAEPATASVGGEDSVTATGVPSDIERAEEAAAEPDTDEPAAEEMAPATDAPETGEEAMAAEPEPREGDFSDTPVFLQVEQEDERAEQEAAARAEAEAEAEMEAAETAAATGSGDDDAAGEYGPVGRGETLWNIASRVKRDDMTVQQMMLALLRYNPEAFADNNINRLKQGYVLRIPDAGNVLSLSAQQAVVQVGEQNALWREFRRAARDGTGRAQQGAGSDASAAASVEGDQANLEIVGSEEGTGASSDEVASATSGTAQPERELRLAREQLESERMEKAELESRVGELEETVGKMERLIELREDQLAKLQEQLKRIEEGADPGEVLAELDEIDTAATGDETATGESGSVSAEEDTDAAAAGDTETGEAVAEEEADEAGTDTGEESAEAATDEAATDEAAMDEAEPAPAADDDGGVTTVRTQPREQDIFDKVTGILDSIGATIGGLVAGIGLGGLLSGPLALPIAGGVGVLVLLGIMLAVRRRGGLGEGEEVLATDAEPVPVSAEDEGEEDFTGLFGEAGEMPDTEDDEALAGLAGGDDSGLAGGDEGESDAEAELMSESFDLEGLEDEGDQTTAIGAESSDDDTIEEANVYLAYGLHQQAEELLDLAIEEQPERTDYREKLLEAIYGGGRADDFVAQAQVMREKVDEDDPNWLRVVAMGQELAPDNELFQQEVDESLKPAATTATQPPDTDLDLGGDDEDSTALDFSFDEDESGGGDAGEIDESDDDTFAQTMMLDSGEFEGREGDAGLVGPDDSDSGESSAADEGVEDDEMEFDLGDLDLDTEDSDAAAESGDEGGSEDFDLGDLDLGGDEEESEDAGAASDEESSGGGEETDFDLSDFDLGEDEEETETAAEQPAAGGDETDFDLGDLGLEEDEETATAGGGTEEGDDEADFDLADLGLGDEGEESTATRPAEGDDETDFDPGDMGLEQDAETATATEGAEEGDDEADFDLSDFDLGEEEAAEGGDDSAEDALSLKGEADSGAMDLESFPGDEEDSADAGADEAESFDFDLSAEETPGETGAPGGETETDLADMDLDDAETSTEESPDDDADFSLEDLAADLAEDDSGLTGPGDDAGTGADETEVTTEAAPGPEAGEAGDEDEYGTMLDLARAYIDMGDAESARSALEEVAESGNDEQRNEARNLLDSI